MKDPLTAVLSQSAQSLKMVCLLITLPKCFSASVESLEKKNMPPKVRSAFVRELIVHMTSYGIRPPRNFCSAVARRIILKYPFLRDAVGSGYVSIV